MRNDVISANKQKYEQSEIQPQDALIASINAHSEIVKQRDAEIAELTKNLKESELKF